MKRTIISYPLIVLFVLVGKPEISSAQHDEFNLQVIKNHIFAQHLYRDKLLRDEYRPTYHFVIPEGMANPFDPNGAFYWKGRYHLFYIIQTAEPKPYYRGDAWAHVSSHDLIHWRYHPTALKPNEDTPERAVYSGNMFLDKNGVPTIMYQGLGAGNCIAFSAGDDMLNDWERHENNPVIPYPDYEAQTDDAEYRAYYDQLPDYGTIDIWDPHCWLDGDTYYAISGDNGTWPGKSGLYKSTDLENWEELGSFFHHDEVEGTLDCPDFFKLGDKYVLLFLRNGLEYIIGDFKKEQFYPEKQGTMTWNLGVGYAPESLVDYMGRRIMWAALNDSRTIWGDLDEFLPRHGWMGTMSLPRMLSLDENNDLLIEPIEEIQALRHGHLTMENIEIANGVRRIDGVTGNTLELEINISNRDAREFGVKVCASVGGAEETVIKYNAVDKKIRIDLTRSSLDKELMKGFYDEETVQVADLALAEDEELKLRIFIDRSVLEVFVNRKLCLTQRIYPTRDESENVFLFSDGGSITVNEFNAWKMHPSNPF